MTVGWGAKKAAGGRYGSQSKNADKPDLRGEFLRGWDHGRGADSGRGFGSAQRGTLLPAEFANSYQIAMLLNFAENTRFGATAIGGYDAYPYNDGLVARGGAVGQQYDSTETKRRIGIARPRNVALLPCIKY
jgi:phage-related tail fiber protein